MSDASAEIARIDGVIADAERCIARQRQMLANMTSEGKVTEEAELALDLMVGTLSYLQHLRLSIQTLFPGTNANA
ncbi:MAG TPA: hypothetical protein VEU06_06015 [Micropepsaceae bacterium]|nr:hypothetical protein [Micropepsaceae bacterium]